jgi:hypothetical protein
MSVVEVDDVVCHFAKTFLGQQGGDVFHVLPLNKVGKLKIILYGRRFFSQPPTRCSITICSPWTGTSTRSITVIHKFLYGSAAVNFFVMGLQIYCASINNQ